MPTYLMVALGSALGGSLRHGVNVASARLLGPQVPYGTLTVNLLASFLIGLLAASCAARGEAAQARRLFLTTGVLGGFTTFSAFSLDTVRLYERGQLTLALGYSCGSVVISMAALCAGLAIMRAFICGSML